MADSLASHGGPGKAALTLGALAFIVVVTGAWWMLALWPVPAEAAEWLVRTRSYCFGVERNGLPSLAGWLSLAGEPVALTLTLFAIQGRALPDALRALNRRPAGRITLLGTSLALGTGVGAAGVRVVRAGEVSVEAAAKPDVGVERLDAPAPPIRLQGQFGASVSLVDFRGRVVLVAFAYGHCETVCPLVVEEVLRARRAAGALSPVVLIVTLDPWRDRPSRLPSIAARWGMPSGTFVLSGGIEEVERVLDEWQVVRQRDPLTGEVSHATPVFVVDSAGRLAARAEPFVASIAAAMGGSLTAGDGL